MDTKKQVVSLEIAKKLKELGYPQNQSEWHWIKYDENRWELRNREFWPQLLDVDYAAPTVAELGEKVPKGVITRRAEGKDNTAIWYAYKNKMDTNSYSYINADTEADARAKMLIYLLENELFKLEEMIK